MIQVFTRTWWKVNPKWPDNREPSMGRKKILHYVETVEEARKICEEWNKNNAELPINKKLGRRAEFTNDY